MFVSEAGENSSKRKKRSRNPTAKAPAPATDRTPSKSKFWVSTQHTTVKSSPSENVGAGGLVSGSYVNAGPTKPHGNVGGGFVSGSYVNAGPTKPYQNVGGGFVSGSYANVGPTKQNENVGGGLVSGSYANVGPTKQSENVGGGLASGSYANVGPTKPNENFASQPADDQEQSQRKTSQMTTTGDDIRTFARKAIQEGALPRKKEQGKLQTLDQSIDCFSVNQDKNAFTNVVLYDRSRVLLNPTLTGDNPYIHASYVFNYAGNYILTQSPMANTILEFWRCVWQEETRLIVSFNQASSRYVYCSPRNKKTCKVGPNKRFSVRTLEITSKPDYDQYQITLKHREGKGVEQRNLFFLHYKKWPENALPEIDSILEFMNEFWQIESSCKAHKTVRGQAPPSVIECSSGVLSSATFLMVSSCCKQLNRSGTLHPCKVALNMRRQRYGAVQSRQQYAYVYVCSFQFACKNGLLQKDKDFREVMQDMKQPFGPK